MFVFQEVCVIPRYPTTFCSLSTRSFSRCCSLHRTFVVANPLNIFTPTFCKFELVLEILCVALYCYSNVLCQKMRKNIFHFHLLYFFSNSNFTLPFCVVLSKAIENSHAKKARETSNRIPICTNFSYKSAPKPVRFLDPSRLESVLRCSRIYWFDFLLRRTLVPGDLKFT